MQSESGKTFIYGLVDPRDGRLRYVGKANDPADRLRRHMNEKQGCHCNRWLSLLRSLGTKPDIIVLEECLQAGWQKREQYWIKTMRDNGASLVNATDGGDGVTGHTPETRAKIGAASRGRKASDETRRKISASLTGNKNNLGIKLSNEHRANISAGLKGRRGPMVGKKHSAEAKAKISAALKGKTKSGHPLTAEAKEKLSALWKGKPWSAARRAAQESAL